jgi:hypothetical protein
MRGPGIIAALAAILIATPALSQQAKRLEQFTDWGAYVSTGTPKVCFAVSQPKESRPQGVRRGPIYFYVSHYPADNVPHEINVKMGYPFAEGAMVTVTVDNEKFQLFTKDEGAFLEKAEDEQRLVAAMRKGSTMRVEGRSARGTDTSDDYSLNGVSNALDRMAQECG